MELKKLIKNTSFLAATSVFKFFVGIIRSKLNAILLGPVGIGIISQLSMMSQQMAQFTTLNMNDAVVKQIAENKDKQEINELVCASLKSYIILVLTFMLLSIIVFIIFSKKLTVYVLGDVVYLPYFYIGLFSFPILILTSIPLAILKGFKDVRSISIATIVSVIANLVVFIPLVLLYKLKGVVIFIPISYFITLLINFLITRKKHLIRLNIGIKTIFNAKMKKVFVKELFLFSGFGLSVGSFSIFSEFVCRAIVVNHLQVKAIGLYRPNIAWSELFVNFLIVSFSTYLFPRFAETKSNEEASGILNDALRLSTFILFPLLFISIPYRNLLINIFYSQQFVEAGKYLPFHFLGVVFYVWWYIYTQSMTPTGRIKQHAIFMVLFLTLNIAVVYITVPLWGLYGWMLKHIISPVVFFIVYYIYLNKSMKFKIEKSNILLMFYLLGGSVILTLGLFWNELAFLMYFLGPALLMFSWFILKRNERIIIYNKLLIFKKRYLKK